mgnify:CR=1 FL=1
MEIKEMIALIRQQKTLEEINLKNRKNNINSSYDLAKHDFRVIDNIEDIIETLTDIIDELEQLQDRIVERNRLPII